MLLLLLLLLLALLLLYGDCPICLLHDACVEIAYEPRVALLPFLVQSTLPTTNTTTTTTRGRQ